MSDQTKQTSKVMVSNQIGTSREETPVTSHFIHTSSLQSIYMTCRRLDCTGAYAGSVNNSTPCDYFCFIVRR